MSPEVALKCAAGTVDKTAPLAGQADDEDDDPSESSGTSPTSFVNWPTRLETATNVPSGSTRRAAWTSRPRRSTTSRSKR